MAKEGKKYIVVFQDEEGNVLKTSFVTAGFDAEPPKIPEIKEELQHHRILFDGWDHSLRAVNTNLVIKPVYKKVPKTYLVMYFGEDGKILGMENVPYGQAAKQELTPQKEDTEEYHYIFKGWNKSLQFIESDIRVKPVFSRKKKRYLVVFCDDANKIISKQGVRYGEMPEIPTEIKKEEDETFTYQFKGWSENITPVKQRAIYRAEFEPIYKEYRLQIFNEGEKLVDRVHHYGDRIRLPELRKKGYELHWSEHKEKITEDTVISSSWEFANPKGKIVECDSGVWRIQNPSIHQGTVSCIQYCTSKPIEKMPEKIKLGDYYYKIICIEKNAFSSCRFLKKIILPNSLEEIEDRGLAQCRKLQKITVGKNTKKLGKQICKGDKALKEITFLGKKLAKISPQVFEEMPGKVLIKAEEMHTYQLERIFAKGLLSGKITLF